MIVLIAQVLKCSLIIRLTYADSCKVTTMEVKLIIGIILCILSCILGLISAAPLFNSVQHAGYATESFEPLGILPGRDRDYSPWYAAVSGFVSSTVGSNILNSVVDCRICGKCSIHGQIQHDAERSAKIMALVQVMDEISIAKGNLNKFIDKKLSMKDDRLVEVQFNELAEFNSIRDTLGNAGDYLKGAAKKILCG